MSYKVTLVGGGGYVRFEASTPVSESRVANYEGFNIVHLPTSLWAYRNTNGRHFSITGKLVSRTPNEATANAGYLTTVRSWVLPDFGNSGAPPPLVFLSAYNNQKIERVPCVVLSYNWSFPDDVDYIFNTDEPMPVIGMLTIELEEAYSAEQITAKAWEIKPKSGGSFSGTGTPGTGSFGGEVYGATDYLYNKGMSSSFPTIGGALILSPDSIANIPAMVESVFNAASGGSMNSGLLSTVVQDAVGLLNNRFVSGISPQQIINGSNVGTPPFLPTVSVDLDVFGRDSNLSIPFFGD